MNMALNLRVAMASFGLVGWKYGWEKGVHMMMFGKNFLLRMNKMTKNIFILNVFLWNPRTTLYLS